MYKLLVIDDEEVIRNGLKAIIEHGGAGISQIFLAKDGREAMGVIAKEQPQIVITDIKMPHLDGLELINWASQSLVQKPVFIIISGYDDFNYARRAIQYGVKDYLLKPVAKEELIKLIENVTRQLDDSVERHEAEILKSMQNKVGLEVLKEKYLQQLLQIKPSEKEGVLKQLLAAGINLKSNLFKVMVLEYRPRNSALEPMDEMERFALKESMDKAISDVSKDFLSFYDSAMRLVILLLNKDSFIIETQVKKIYERVNRCFEQELILDTFFGVGENASGLMEIPNSYRGALQAVLYKIGRDAGGLVYSKDLLTDDPGYSGFMVYFVKITSEIEMGMRQNLISLITECLQKINVYNTSVTRLASFYNDLTRYIYDYFTNKGIDFSLIFETEPYFRDLDYFWTVTELQSYLEKNLLKLCDLVLITKGTNPDRKLIEQVVRYIYDNFDKDINLNLVAEHFSKNNSYLSVLFKKETGRNFVDFLTAIRIEKAKELLAQSSLKIQEIATQTGYLNAKHFCTVFKKAVGVSPFKYREQSL